MADMEGTQVPCDLSLGSRRGAGLSCPCPEVFQCLEEGKTHNLEVRDLGPNHSSSLTCCVATGKALQQLPFSLISLITGASQDIMGQKQKSPQPWAPGCVCPGRSQPLSADPAALNVLRSGSLPNTAHRPRLHSGSWW